MCFIVALRGKLNMFSLLLLIIIYLAFISLGLPDSLLGSAWPAMYKSLNVPLHYAGIISMIISAGTVISSLLSAKIIRKVGTGIVTLVSVLMTAVALIAFSLTNNFLYLCVFAIPLGLGAGSVDSALNNFVALHYKARHMSWLHCFWGIGASIGPLIMSAYLSKGLSWSNGYCTIGVVQLCLVLVLIITLPLWKKIALLKGGINNDDSSFATSYRKLFLIPGLKEALAVFFCYCSIEALAGLWGASYLVTARNIAPDKAAGWIALYYIGITLGRFISGFLTIKFNNTQMVRFGQILILIGITMLLLPFNFLLVPGFFTIGLGCAPIYPSLLHETPNNFGKEHSQAIMGIQMACAYIGTTLMPPFFGKLAAYFSFSILPLILAVILFVKIILTELVNKKTKKTYN